MILRALAVLIYYAVVGIIFLDAAGRHFESGHSLRGALLAVLYACTLYLLASYNPTDDMEKEKRAGRGEEQKCQHRLTIPLTRSGKMLNQLYSFREIYFEYKLPLKRLCRNVFWNNEILNNEVPIAYYLALKDPDVVLLTTDHYKITGNRNLDIQVMWIGCREEIDFCGSEKELVSEIADKLSESCRFAKSLSKK